jgi:hypothetical protein
MMVCDGNLSDWLTFAEGEVFCFGFSLGFLFLFSWPIALAPDDELSKDKGWMAFNKEGGEVEPAR